MNLYDEYKDSPALNPKKSQRELEMDKAYALNKRRDNLKKRLKSKKKRKLWCELPTHSKADGMGFGFHSFMLLCRSLIYSSTRVFDSSCRV